MRSRAATLIVVAALLLAALWPLCARAQTPQIEQLQAQIQRLHAQIAQLQRDQTRKQRENDDLGRRIAALKRRVAAAPDFVAKQRLDELLNQQRELSRELSALETRLNSRRNELDRARIKLRALYAEQLNRLSLLIDAEADRTRKAELLAQYLELRQAKSAIPAAPNEPTESAWPTQLTIDPLDTLDELREKAAILRDTERRVRERMRRLQAAIAELEQDKRMDLEMWETIERERFFEDGGVVRSTGQDAPPNIEQYDRQIAGLQLELNRLTAVAEELARRAALFEREADARRKGGDAR